MLSFLDKVREANLTDDQLQNLEIQLSDLDFVTGKTSELTTSYFMPSKQDLDIVNSGIDPVEDKFTKGCKSEERKVYGDRGWPDYLEAAFLEYSFALSSKHFDMWDSIMYACCS